MTHRKPLAATILAAALLCVAAAAQAQAPAATGLNPVRAFTGAPRKVFPLLTQITRLDMVDYFNSGSDKPSRDLLEGNARITDISPASITVEQGTASTTTLALLPRGNDTIIAAITTLSTPEPVSFIDTYTAAWQPIEGAFTTPTLQQWLTPQGRKHIDDIERAIAFVPATITINPANATITLTNTLEQFTPADEFAPIKQYFRPTLTYKLKRHKWVQAK